MLHCGINRQGGPLHVACRDVESARLTKIKFDLSISGHGHFNDIHFIWATAIYGPVLW